MTVNHYFQSGRSIGSSNEQDLVESLIIECLQIYGFDVFYIPRKSVNPDLILNEDVLNKYEGAIQIEMYLESNMGFEGEGSLLTKFGVELRDQATFIVSKRRWNTVVSQHTEFPSRPAEGDIIYFPLTKSYFEIRKNYARNPFFQIGKLYVWKLECELMQFSSEIFDTGNTEIDSINDVTLDVRAFGLDTESGLPLELEGNASSTLTVEEYEIENSDPLAQNDKFNSEIDIVDFSESNPFGDIRDNQ